jgi:hypothetical protein
MQFSLRGHSRSNRDRKIDLFDLNASAGEMMPKLFALFVCQSWGMRGLLNRARLTATRVFGLGRIRFAHRAFACALI